MMRWFDSLMFSVVGCQMWVENSGERRVKRGESEGDNGGKLKNVGGGRNPEPQTLKPGATNSELFTRDPEPKLLITIPYSLFTI